MLEEVKKEGDESQLVAKKPSCGIIMPISSIGSLSESHWIDVRDLLYDIISSAGFEPNLVSERSDVGVIHGRIVKNTYASDIIVCDISAQNPNVMLELGLRLAFDKPVVIIKDELTSSPFDINNIEYINYPRDLRYTLIQQFKEKLKQKLLATYQNSRDKNSGYTSFLGHFKIYHTPKIETKEVSPSEFLGNFADELVSEIRSLISYSKADVSRSNVTYNTLSSDNLKELILKRLNFVFDRDRFGPDALNDAVFLDITCDRIRKSLERNNIVVSHDLIKNVIIGQHNLNPVF